MYSSGAVAGFGAIRTTTKFYLIARQGCRYYETTIHAAGYELRILPPVNLVIRLELEKTGILYIFYSSCIVGWPQKIIRQRMSKFSASFKKHLQE